MKALIVDDEALARRRLRQLLQDQPEAESMRIDEAHNGASARQQVLRLEPDLVFLDIHMPGEDGMQLARWIAQQPGKPEVVFVTAHAEHALEAFEVQALDYLTKPVRATRLAQSLEKWRSKPRAKTEAHVLIHERGRSTRIALGEILYFKAELKYLTVRTRKASHILEGSLNELEAAHERDFVRIHRNALVARAAIRSLQLLPGPSADDDGSEGWHVLLDGLDEPLAVSRRQLAAVRELLRQ